MKPQSPVDYLANIVDELGYVPSEAYKEAKRMEEELFILAYTDVKFEKWNKPMSGEDYYAENFNT
jgi:hypothetical protein